MKWDEHCNARNKSQIMKLDLDDLMNQLIAWNNDYKDREKFKKTDKTEFDEKNEKKSTNSNFNSKFNNSDLKFNSNVNSNKKSNKKRSWDKNRNKNKNDCNYCEQSDHIEANCYYKFSENMSKSWRDNNQADIAYFKKKNARKLNKSKDFNNKFNDNSKFVNFNKSLAAIFRMRNLN